MRALRLVVFACATAGAASAQAMLAANDAPPLPEFAQTAPAAWLTTLAFARRPHASSCSTAAARNVSAAASMTEYPRRLSQTASLPSVDVLPAPLTPTARITKGLWSL